MRACTCESVVCAPAQRTRGLCAGRCRRCSAGQAQGAAPCAKRLYHSQPQQLHCRFTGAEGLAVTLYPSTSPVRRVGRRASAPSVRGTSRPARTTAGCAGAACCAWTTTAPGSTAAWATATTASSSSFSSVRPSSELAADGAHSAAACMSSSCSDRVTAKHNMTLSSQGRHPNANCPSVRARPGY